MNPAAYGIMHRKHHAHSDTQKDPHSPIHTNNVFAFNLKTLTEYRRLVIKVLDEKFDTQDLPRWLALEKLAEPMLGRVCFVILYFTILMHLGMQIIISKQTQW